MSLFTYKRISRVYGVEVLKRMLEGSDSASKGEGEN